MNLDILLIYTSVAFFYVISPGPAVFLAISNGISADMKAVLLSTLGNICGLFLLSSVSILGLGALMMTSAVLFTAVKVCGALYLLYLGIRQIKQAKNASLKHVAGHGIKQRSEWRFFTEGFFLAATNPKPILFFTALFPQFLDLNSSISIQFFIMTSIFMAFSFISLLSYASVFKRTKHIMTNGNFMKWFHRVTGGAFITMSALMLQLKHQ